MRSVTSCSAPDPETRRMERIPRMLWGRPCTDSAWRCDPINYSDPFGLCPPVDNSKCTIAEQAMLAFQRAKDQAVMAVANFGNAAWSAVAKIGKEAAIQIGLAA